MSELDLALGVLDHQLVDCDGRRCGKVDDLELEGLSSGTPHVSTILVGPPAWRTRSLLGRIAARIARGRLVRVPWSEVERVRAAVELRSSASDLRLGRADDRALRIVERIPGSSL